MWVIVKKTQFFWILGLVFALWRITAQTPLNPIPENRIAIIKAFHQKKDSIGLRTTLNLWQRESLRDTAAEVFGYRQLANLYYDTMQFVNAIKINRIALDLATHATKMDAHSLAATQLMMGIFFRDGAINNDSAVYYFRQALNGFESNPNNIAYIGGTVNTAAQLIAVYTRTGNLLEANELENQFKDKVASVEAKFQSNWHRYTAKKNEVILGTDPQNVMQIKDSAIFNQNLNHYQYLLHYYDSLHLPKKNAQIVLNRANLYLKARKGDWGATDFQHALRVYQSEKDTLAWARALGDWMSYHVIRKDLAKAEQAIQHASHLLQTFYKYQNHPNRTDLFLKWGHLRFQQKQWKACTAFSDSAIVQSLPSTAFYDSTFLFPSTRDLETLLNHEGVLEALANKALGFKKLYDTTKDTLYLKASLRCSQLADLLTYQVRRNINSDESQFLYGEKVTYLYQQAMETAMIWFRLDPSKADTVVNWLGRNKAFVLRQHRRREIIKQFVGIPDSILQIEKILFWQAAQCRNNVFNTASDSQRVPALKALMTAEQELHDFVNRLEKTPAYRPYFEHQYAQQPTFSVAAIRKNNNDSTMVVDYYWSADSLYTTAITSKSFKVYVKPVTDSLRKELDTLITSLHLLQQSDSIAKKLSRVTYALYQRLLESPLQDIPKLLKINQLRIIPSGKLGYVPFDVLATRRILNWKQKDTALLVWQYAISYEYALDFMQSDTNPTAQPCNYCGFGIGYGQQYRNSGSDKKSLDNLLKTEEDVRKQSARFKAGNVWTEQDNNASTTIFYQQSPRCNILHLAMHGVVNDTNSLNSSLIFVQGDSLQNTSVSELHARLRLPINDLSILNACNTGNGILRNGEGIISLSRAFAQAGSRSVLMSSWSLNEAQTSEILDYFFEYLQKGENKAIALQHAKQKFLEQERTSDFRMPHYWASTVLTGSTQPLNWEKPNRMNWIWWFLIGGGLSFWIWRCFAPHIATK